ncbi:MAG: diadenylate cyclase [Fibrobacterota bacterium]
MSFSEYICCDDIVELVSEEKNDALTELAGKLCEHENISSPRKLIKDINSREESASTFVGQGVAIPQSEANIKNNFSIIVGRSAMGVDYGAVRNARAHIIVLVVSNKKMDDDSALAVLSEISTFFRNETVNKLIRNAEVEKLSQVILRVSKDTEEAEKVTGSKKNAARGKKEPLLSAAASLARDVNAKAVMVLADAKKDNEFVKYIKTRRQVILVTSNKTRFKDESIKFKVTQAPTARGGLGYGQVKIGVLLAVSRGLVGKDDVIVCVTGDREKDQFNSVVVIDIAKEFDFFFNTTRSLVPDDVKPEILERVLGLASEISLEGRENSSIGTIFVVGDTNRVNANVTQLIINPFRGYSESERNIIDPGLEETVKEFASIDGAFIITGDGVVLSAGSYLRPRLTEEEQLTRRELASGLGARHAAAADITACTNALAITVSESTGQITVFKNGAIALTLQRPLIH